MIYIYGLSDPREGIVRYVGKAYGRLNVNHCTYTDDNGYIEHDSEWLSRLIEDNVEPVLTILQVVDEEGGDAALEYWIKRIEDSDGSLLTLAKKKGRKWTKSQRDKFSETRKGKPIKQSDPKGRRAAALKKAWIRRKLEGRTSWGKHSPESKKKISESKRRYHPQDTIENKENT